MPTEVDDDELRGRLKGVPILVVATRGTDAALVHQAVAAVGAAGATLSGTWWLTDQWDFDDEVREGELGTLIEPGGDLTVAEAVDRFRRNSARRLAALLLEGRPSGERPELVAALVAGGFVEHEPAPGSGTRAVLPGPGARYVVVAGDAPDTGAHQFAHHLVGALAEGGEARRITVAAQGLLSDADGDEGRTTFVGPIRTGEVTRERIATVDHLDLPIGRAALVLALEDLGRGAVGHYGVGPGADAVRPERTPTRRARLVAAVRHAPMESWVGGLITLGCVVFVLLQLQPADLVANTTPAGGDMGAHVWGPAYLRDHLLPHFRLTGWSPDWYAGFPAFQFYMLPPALLIVLFDVVLPYGIAMKLVTVLGVLALPACAYVMGRLFRLPFPGPPLLAVAMVPFLFDRTWSIYGGNIPSTLAGEFAFSISLSLALLFFGFLARGLENGRHRGLTSVLLALVILCHAIPAFFALVGGVVLVLMRFDRKRVAFAVPILGLGCLLTAFWSVPFVLQRGYLTDMGWERLEDYRAALLPDDTRWVLVLALVGIVLALAFWIRVGAFFGVLAGLLALGVRADVGSPVHIWNARLLPFFYLCLYALAAVGVSEVLRSIAVIIDGGEATRRRVAEWVGVVGAFGATVVLVALPLRTLPGGTIGTDGSYRWFGLTTRDDSYIDSWAKWNYSGYERKPNYPEYRGIVTTMQGLGDTIGCGRAQWEYEGDLNRYGTPMALMLLPFWTDGCIGSMEGLYFESAGSTPFHFLNAAETSVAPSNPVRDQPDRPMPYSGLDLTNGVRHLQMMGVRYYMAFSDAALEAAKTNPDLTEVASSPPWKVYEIDDSELVEPLANEPAVLEGLLDTNPDWQRDAVAWYTDPSALDVLLASDGPESWQRIARGDDPERRELPPTKVSNIVEKDMSISFDVDRVGEPVLVKTSYFPNWKASGADGPYHVTPNLMVVIPTSEHVELSFGNTSVEYLGWAGTLAAAAALIWLARRGPVTFPVPAPVAAAPPPGDDGDDEDMITAFGTPRSLEDGGADVDPERLFWAAEPRNPDEFWQSRFRPGRHRPAPSPPPDEDAAGSIDEDPADDPS